MSGAIRTISPPMRTSPVGLVRSRHADGPGQARTSSTFHKTRKLAGSSQGHSLESPRRTSSHHRRQLGITGLPSLHTQLAELRPTPPSLFFQFDLTNISALR
ncbi:hypothetical protein MPTK1_5g02460 [Marchantia polymorpha subsp. ruderalis]|uniref:Uncharacterized protein n=2 Tax=Marchantia polymorpha TaxID=3197 RepID=A0AAF6BE69_MARPO|nr:hypothetical protein MARPO_0147s0039 [Marchantia polymorpha]BBN10303.1 hypothetical protein Mp_5g02460 [Marchantia polymorpha subsp. ruderalis]|eukprot:PTQ29164.1 hypothetical protein MARPO_0147s0039 [Marchantia polymorpha]